MHPVHLILVLEQALRALQPGRAQHGFDVRLVVVALKEDEAVRLLPQRLQRGRDALRVVRIQQEDGSNAASSSVFCVMSFVPSTTHGSAAFSSQAAR